MVKNEPKRNMYVGLGARKVPSVGVLEADVLRILWDKGEPIPFMDVYLTLYNFEKSFKRTPSTPGTTIGALQRLIAKGLVKSIRTKGKRKVDYKVVVKREFIIANMIDDVLVRLGGTKDGTDYSAHLGVDVG